MRVFRLSRSVVLHIPFWHLLPHVDLSLSLSQARCPSSLPLPVVLPVRNVKINSQVARRGVAVRIGTPSQPLSFELSG